MATGKFMDIRKTEKYMDDACFAAMSNLYRAVRKKSSHIWSDRFTSLQSVFGDDDKQETNDVYERNNCSKKDSRISWKVTCAGDSDATKTLSDESVDWNEGTGEGVRKVEWIITKGDTETENTQTVSGSLHDNKMKSYHQSLNGLSVSKASAAHQEPSSRHIPESINRRKNMPNFNGDSFKRPSHGRSEEPGVRTGPIRNTGWREKNDKCVAGERAEKSRGHSQTKRLAHKKDNSRRPLSQTSTKSNHNGENLSVCEKQENIEYKMTFPENLENSVDQLTRNSYMNKKTTLRSKRTRRDSDSSSDSTLPLQKMLLKSDERRKDSSSDISEGFLDTMLSVKIMNNAQWYEFIISSSDFNRIKRKYPKFSEDLPDIDTEEKEFNYSYDAVKAVFGFLFNPPYNYNTMPTAKGAIEVLVATKTWNILQFHNAFLNKFLKIITVNNCVTIYSLARYFGLSDVCDACQAFVAEGVSFNEEVNERLVMSRKCSVLIYTYVEPTEYLIPLKNAYKDFEDYFDKDIRNIIIFEAISSDSSITGFGLHLDSDCCNAESARLDIFYTVKLMDGISESEEIKLSKPLRSNIIMHFKRKLVVKKGQKLQISVEITIKPSMCFASSEDVIEENTSGFNFKIHTKSTYKVANSNEKRFFIGKLLYNALVGKD